MKARCWVVLALACWGFHAYAKPLEEKPPAQQAPEAATPKPSEDEICELVAGTLKGLSEAIAAKDFRRFYESLSPAFREATTPRGLFETFGEYFKGTNLEAMAAMRPILWPETGVKEAGKLEVAGMYPSYPNMTVFAFNYARVDGAWMLQDIRFFGMPSEIGPVPAYEAVAAKVRANAGALLQAIHSGEYRAFYLTLSAAFRFSHSPDEIAEAFGPMKETLADLPDLAGLRLRLTSWPAVDEDRLLRVSGRFEGEARHLGFSFAYVYERGDWSLFVLELKHKPGKAPEVPSNEELRALVGATLRDFNEAVARGDFTDFHTKLCAPFREQCSAEKLGEVFATFIKKRIDIGAAKGSNAVFQEPPRVDHEDVLHLKGYIQMGDAKVTFALKYLPEDAAWRLLGINVNVE